MFVFRQEAPPAPSVSVLNTPAVGESEEAKDPVGFESDDLEAQPFECVNIV
jgi:hypothetical protein